MIFLWGGHRFSFNRGPEGLLRIFQVCFLINSSTEMKAWSVLAVCLNICGVFGILCSVFDLTNHQEYQAAMRGAEQWKDLCIMEHRRYRQLSRGLVRGGFSKNGNLEEGYADWVSRPGGRPASYSPKKVSCHYGCIVGVI